MTFEEFEKFEQELIAEVVKMNDTKGREYARGEDRFGNFNRGAEKNAVSRLVVANIYLSKHLDAIDNYIRTGGRTFSTEGIRGRVVDAIKYLVLIEGMIEEDIERQGTWLCDGATKGKHSGCFHNGCGCICKACSDRRERILLRDTELCLSSDSRNFKCTLPLGHAGNHNWGSPICQSKDSKGRQCTLLEGHDRNHVAYGVSGIVSEWGRISKGDPTIKIGW
jgi:hypothetical protein